MENKVQNLVKEKVNQLLENENSGHGMEHITRVLGLALKFAEVEDCNKELVALIALLHDVDDYKLFGNECQQKLLNTNRILDEVGAHESIRQIILDGVASIGFSKRLNGIEPKSIEAKIVSDADMCEAMGLTGVLRTYKYSMKHNKPFFSSDEWPIDDMSADKYTRASSESSVCHIFEKILKLKNLMLTKSGKEEAKSRHEFVVLLLRQLFKEENAPEWDNYLDDYLNKL